MSRLLLLAAVTATAALFVSGAQASTFGDTATGAGSAGPCLVDGPSAGFCGFPARRFSFFAIGFPGGAFGLYTHRTVVGGTIVARVSCIEVEGNRAVFGGTSLTTSGVPYSGAWSVWVVDNGPAGGTPPDRISPVLLWDDPKADPCAKMESPGGHFEVTTGNILVTDGELLFP